MFYVMISSRGHAYRAPLYSILLLLLIFSPFFVCCFARWNMKKTECVPTTELAKLLWIKCYSRLEAHHHPQFYFLFIFSSPLLSLSLFHVMRKNHLNFDIYFFFLLFSQKKNIVKIGENVKSLVFCWWRSEVKLKKNVKKSALFRTKTENKNYSLSLSRVFRLLRPTSTRIWL